MSLLKLKQLQGPAANSTGSAVVFDGTKPVWSSTSTSGLRLPSGSNEQRPGVGTVANGHIRYNSSTGKIEAYANNAWLDIAPMVGATNNTVGKAGFVPAPAAAENEKFLRGDGLWAAPNLGFKMFQFKVYIDGSGNIATGSVGGADIRDMSLNGESWSFTRVNTSQLTVTHNKGFLPIMATTWGLNTLNGYVQKVPSNNIGTALGMSHDPANFNFLNFYGLTGGNTNASAGQHILCQVFFSN